MGKLLTVLGVSETLQENLPPEIFQGEQMINVMQTVYESAPESNKKTALASAISESVRLLLLEIEKYKNIQVNNNPKEEEPKKELPFKIGDKFCMKGVKFPYTIEAIDYQNEIVEISGFSNDGTPKKADFDLNSIISKVEKGILFTCPEKNKRGRKPKPKAETPKAETPKAETPKTTSQKPEKPKIHDPEVTKKIKEYQEEIDEINDTLVAFDEGSEDYEILVEELNRLKKEIEKLKK